MDRSARTTAAARAARRRRIKKEIAAMVRESHREVFERAVEQVVRDNPKCSAVAFVRWFNLAWHKADPYA